jgi:hypothetical protein
MLMMFWTPIDGRMRLVGWGLLRSVRGLPKAGSFGSLSETTFPHGAPTQLPNRDLGAAILVRQFPRGSPADAQGRSPDAEMAVPVIAKIILQSVAPC